jgi:Protein of unknown function (DUF3618)
MEKPNQLSGTNGGYGVSAVTPPIEPNTDQDIRHLRTEISENQAQLHDTVAEIQERLSPTHLKEQATTAVRDATVGKVKNMMNRAGETAGQMGRTTRQAAEHVASEVGSNALPYALIAIGASWLLTTRHRKSRWDGDDSEYDRAHYSSSSGAPHTGVDNWSTGARDRARDVASTARGRFERMLNDNPLVLGVAAMATGAIVAAALPATELEQRYLAEASETIVESAKEAAQGAVDKITGSGSEQPA